MQRIDKEGRDAFGFSSGELRDTTLSLHLPPPLGSQLLGMVVGPGARLTVQSTRHGKSRASGETTCNNTNCKEVLELEKGGGAASGRGRQDVRLKEVLRVPRRARV